MTPIKLVIAAPVWARNDTEATRLRVALAALDRCGFPVVLADNGSPPDFVADIGALPNVTVLPKGESAAPRLTGQIQRAFAAARALSPGWILYTEPDKQWFFENRLANLAELADQFGDSAILIPARSRESFATFPAYQQKTETAFNKFAADWLGNYADLLYGPLLLRADLTQHLDPLTEDVGWGWRPYLMAIAKRTRQHPQKWMGDFPCPLDQRDEDTPKDRLYRIRQLSQCLNGLALGFSVPLENEEAEG